MESIRVKMGLVRMTKNFGVFESANPVLPTLYLHKSAIQEGTTELEVVITQQKSEK